MKIIQGCHGLTGKQGATGKWVRSIEKTGPRGMCRTAYALASIR
jgi:hypothetical protein